MEHAHRHDKPTRVDIRVPETPVESNSSRWGTVAMFTVFLIPLLGFLIGALLIFLLT